MLPKYLRSDCLVIKEPAAVTKILEMLSSGKADEIPAPKFIRTDQEKKMFFDRINKKR